MGAWLGTRWFVVRVFTLLLRTYHTSTRSAHTRTLPTDDRAASNESITPSFVCKISLSGTHARMRGLHAPSASSLRNTWMAVLQSKTVDAPSGPGARAASRRDRYQRRRERRCAEYSDSNRGITLSFTREKKSVTSISEKCEACPLFAFLAWIL